MIEIINNNVLEFNTDKKYHAIISDPPYGLASSVHEGYKRPYHEIAEKTVYGSTNGRFPANFGLICECEKEPCECVESELDELSGNTGGGSRVNRDKSRKFLFDDSKFDYVSESRGFNDKGGASRFFYTAKASSKERELGVEITENRSNNHPTVKPIKLIEYLATLLLPPIENSNLLIPFSGVGSEIIGANLAGWDNITGVEIDENYVNIANKRLEHWTQYNNYDDAMKSRKLPIDKQLELL